MNTINKMDYGFIAIGLLWSLSLYATAEDRFNVLDDAAVSQARIWQNGGKAKPIMSSDGKIIFAYGQSMPKLTCSPTRACDIEMEPNEKVFDVILGDKINWKLGKSRSMEQGQTILHVIIQPIDIDLETNAIITTDHRTYHIKLQSPHTEGTYLNRVGFYYPQELVTKWESDETVVLENNQKKTRGNILPAPVNIAKLDFGYRMEGKADFQPIRVFNDGERTYFEMPDSLNTGENPVLFLYDENNDVMMVNYRREEDPETRKVHYVVDKLFVHCELRAGSDSVQIWWKKKEKSVLQRFGIGKD
jgi:type IV secretion system protein VirB9